MKGYQRFEPDAMVARAESFRDEMARRRTVRMFSSDPVSDEVIRAAIATAGTAPSGANLQPWRFVVIRNPALKKKIREGAEEEERAFYAGRAPQAWLDALAPLGTDAEKPFLETAPVLIAIFAERWGVGADGEKQQRYYVNESVGIATGLLIAALHRVGLATVTHTPSPMGFLRELCGRPPQDKPYLLLVVGHPAADAAVPDIQRLPLDAIATWRS